MSSAVALNCDILHCRWGASGSVKLNSKVSMSNQLVLASESVTVSLRYRYGCYSRFI